MLSDDKRIRIITGHYGSGKTEFSVNYVMNLRKEIEGNIAIADMDVVNVYFRSREKKEILENAGIRVIGSSIQGNALDLPAISAEVMSPIDDKSYSYIVDLGGDAVGSRAFARFAGNLTEDDYDLFFIINANREETMDTQGVIKHIKSIEATTQLKVTGLINNTHMVRETSLEDVIRGQRLAEDVSKIMNLPIKYVVCTPSLLEEMPKDLDGELFPIKKLYMREDWM